MVFILAVIIYGATPLLDEEIVIQKFHSMIECRKYGSELYARLASEYSPESFTMTCYRSTKEFS